MVHPTIVYRALAVTHYRVLRLITNRTAIRINASLLSVLLEITQARAHCE